MVDFTILGQTLRCVALQVRQFAEYTKPCQASQSVNKRVPCTHAVFYNKQVNQIITLLCDMIGYKEKVFAFLKSTRFLLQICNFFISVPILLKSSEASILIILTMKTYTF